MKSSAVALLIIDVQREFFSAEPGPAGADRVIEQINGLSARARRAGVPVIVVQHHSVVEGPQLESAGWALDARLNVDNRDLFLRKTTPDVFYHTELGAFLKQGGVGEVVICGYATEFCIDTTARSAVGKGYTVTLVTDGHTTEDKAHLSAEAIIAHHNVTLPEITGFAAPILGKRACEIAFPQPTG